MRDRDREREGERERDRERERGRKRETEQVCVCVCHPLSGVSRLPDYPETIILQASTQGPKTQNQRTTLLLSDGWMIWMDVSGWGCGCAC